MERGFGSVRKETLNSFLIIGRAQIETILDEYVAFYNSRRPHQGIQQQIPKPGNQTVGRGMSARVPSLVGCTIIIFNRRRNGWKKSPALPQGRIRSLTVNPERSRRFDSRTPLAYLTLTTSLLPLRAVVTSHGRGDSTDALIPHQPLATILSL